ncbi:MAG: mucoidy inhibitor MuiA family protein [Bacteroidia bacterium]
MKHIVFSLLFISQIFIANGQPTSIKTGKVESVTVYFNGASIVEKHSITLKEGNHTLVFENLPNSIDAGKTYLEGNNQVYILSNSVTHKTYDDINTDSRLTQLNDSIEKTQSELKINQYKIDALNTELALFQKNLYIGGSQTGVNITELQKASELYRIRQEDIYKRLSICNEKVQEINNLKSKLIKRKNEIFAHLTLLNAKLITQIQVSKTGTYNLNLIYFTGNAAWKPIYDIRVSEIGKAINLVQKGKILNNTNVDWKNVKMTLSTADPSLSIIRPELEVWELGHNKPLFKQKYESGRYDMDGEEEIQYKNTSGDVKRGFTFQVQKPEPTIIFVSELTNEFAISGLATIESNSDPKTLEITSYTMDAWYEYIAIPKIDNTPYLIAKTTAWKAIPLSDGPANIYIGNNFIGESYINMRSVTDTLEISMGRNKK